MTPEEMIALVALALKLRHAKEAGEGVELEAEDVVALYDALHVLSARWAK